MFRGTRRCNFPIVVLCPAPGVLDFICSFLVVSPTVWIKTVLEYYNIYVLILYRWVIPTVLFLNFEYTMYTISCQIFTQKTRTTVGSHSKFFGLERVNLR